MLGLYPPARKKATPPRPRLFVEQLEERDCPTTLTFFASVLPDHEVRLEGFVSDGPLAGVNINFYGAAWGSTTTDENGYFHLVTSDCMLGTVFAEGYDSNQEFTNIASADLYVMPPMLSLEIVGVSGNMVTLSGHVDGIDRGNLTVNLYGAASALATTDSYGNFTVTTWADALGDIYATVDDLWGQVSEQATASITSNPPTIMGFTCLQETGRVWTFYGWVSDEDPEGLTVSFGGIPSLEGQSTTVRADGSFSFTIELQPGEDGTVTAQTFDWFGQYSEIEYTMVG
jgi:hypothetical protein